MQGSPMQGSLWAVPSAGQANCPPGVPPVEDSSGAGSLLYRKGRGRAPEPTRNNDNTCLGRMMMMIMIYLKILLEGC